MDNSVNVGYDLWKSETSSRPSSVDLPSSASIQQLSNFSSPLEFESVPSIFSFPTCPPNYRDLQVLKEKGPHDIADALLSLKHPIVHPQLGSPLSPISPSGGMPYFPSPHQGFNSGMAPSCTQGLPYPVSHNPSVLHNTYSTVPQYSQQYETGQLSPTQPPTPNVHFPSMSVNVSMSMNVGVPPGLGNGQYNNIPQQWGNQPQSPTLSQYHSGHNPGLQPQYPGCGPQTHPFQGSYSFTPELRGHGPESRGFYYKAEGLKDVARFCATGHFKKSKFLPDRPPPQASFNDACSMKTNFCRICGKTYARPSTLKTHLRTHSGEKPYKCHICNKSFSQAANLTAHTRTHSGEKPFRCPVCERRFSQSSSVTTHMRTHSGERPYRCRLCKKAFSDSSTLTKHLRIHSGEKPYQCKLCLLRFSQSGNLNRHMRVHANNN